MFYLNVLLKKTKQMRGKEVEKMLLRPRVEEEAV